MTNRKLACSWGILVFCRITRMLAVSISKYL